MPSPKISVPALLFALCASGAWADPFTITSQLTGDIRAGTPHNLFVDVTISGNDATSFVTWLVDINSPAQTNIKLDEFYFNMAGAASDYAFSNFNPSGWAVQSPASVRGVGGTTFMFETFDAPGPPNAADITNLVSLSFTMTLTATAPSALFNATLFTGAPSAVSNEGGSGQLGAHLQSLSGGCGSTAGPCATSGFTFGNYVKSELEPPNPNPEPATLALFGIALAGMGWSRRRNLS